MYKKTLVDKDKNGTGFAKTKGAMRVVKFKCFWFSFNIRYRPIIIFYFGIIKKPEQSPIIAPIENIDVPGFKIRTTPKNPMSKIKKIFKLIRSLRIGKANNAMNKGDAAFNNVASDKPIFAIAKYKQVIAEILIKPLIKCI